MPYLYIKNFILEMNVYLSYFIIFCKNIVEYGILLYFLISLLKVTKPTKIFSKQNVIYFSSFYLFKYIESVIYID